jgi:hypothetical protein
MIGESGIRRVISRLSPLSFASSVNSAHALINN